MSTAATLQQARSKHSFKVFHYEDRDQGVTRAKEIYGTMHTFRYIAAEIPRGLNRKSYKSSRIMAPSQAIKSVNCSSRVQGSSFCS